jgi:hypothetical protein
MSTAIADPKMMTSSSSGRSLFRHTFVLTRRSVVVVYASQPFLRQHLSSRCFSPHLDRRVSTNLPAILTSQTTLPNRF